MGTVRTAIYCRISDDRGGDGAGVARQEKDCRALAARLGWEVAEAYVDNDTSAWSGRKRPAYARMLEDIVAGTVQGVICWHLDRLHRRPLELEEFFAVVDRAGIGGNLRTCSGDYDLASPDGVLAARIMGAVAAKESADKSRRIRRKHRELAEQGRPSGGGARPFGFEDDGVTHREGEAELIREAARWIIGGGSVGGLCRRWEGRVPTVTGKPWKTTTLRGILTRPRVAGLRVSGGERFTATWEPILEVGTWEQVCATLGDPARRQGGRPRSYLLTGGFARCGLCGSKMVAGRKDDGKPRYRCAGPWSGGYQGTCGKVFILAEPLETFITDTVVEALTGADLGRFIATRTGDDVQANALQASIERDQVALAKIDADHYDGLLTRNRWVAQAQRLGDRIEANTRALGRLHGSSVMVDVPRTARLLRARWDAETVAWRRRVLGVVVETVTVGPAVRGRNFFDRDRVTVGWVA